MNDFLTIAILALAVARLARLVTMDSIFDRPRNALLFRWPNEDTIYPEQAPESQDPLGYTIAHVKGNEVFRGKDGNWYASDPRKWSEVFSCVWCASVWVGIIVWAVYLLYPVTVYYLTPLALAQIGGLLNES